MLLSPRDKAKACSQQIVFCKRYYIGAQLAFIGQLCGTESMSRIAMLVSKYLEKFLEIRLCLAPDLEPRQCFGRSNSEGYRSVLTWLFSKHILFLKQNKTVFCGEMATNGRKRYFILTKTLLVNKCMLYQMMQRVLTRMTQTI